MNTKRYIKPLTQILTLSEDPVMASQSNDYADSKKQNIVWQIDEEDEEPKLPHYNVWEDE